MEIAPGRTTPSARRLTLWAGRLIVAISALHIVFFVTVSWEYLPGWFTGDLWGHEPFGEDMSQSQAHFWVLIGSFAVPLLLLGAVVARSATEDRPLPAYVTWALTAWVVVCALVLEPAGLPFLLVPAGMLVAAEVSRKRA